MSTVETTSTAARPEPYWDGVARSYIPPAELSIAPELKLHTGAADDIDPITYEVVRYSLMNTNLEHSELLQRLSVSQIVMLSRDCQASVLTETGDVVFVGPNLQYFSNSHELSIKWTLENRSADPGIGPGDMYISNDPFVGAPHQPDTGVMAPVFVGDELFCWVANSLHHSDLGGTSPGSFCIGAQDAFDESTSWPAVKLVEAGKLRVDVEQLFARQSRVPVQVRMDLRAAVAANEVAKRKIEKLIDRYGAEVVKGVMRGTLDHGEQTIAERLKSIPDGRWSHRAYTEAAVPGDREVYAYQVNIAKQGDRLIVDNEGTDPQAGAINVTYAAFAGAVLAAVTQMMTSDLAGAYGGVYRRVEFRPVSGLLNCAEFPAAVSPSGALTTEMQLNIAGVAVSKMLACGDDSARELILGPNIPHMYAPIAGGLDGDGNYFVFPNVNNMMGSIAGRPDRDGIDSGGHWWIPDGIAPNVEDLEAQYPLVYLYRKLLPAGLDGSGRHRGGLGFVEAMSGYGSGGIAIDLYEDDSFVKGEGLFGGSPGSRASFRVVRGDQLIGQLAEGEIPGDAGEVRGEEIPTGFKGKPIAVTDGDVWEWSSPSTAGYGDPLRRDPEAVLADVAAVGLDAATAERVYGVVLAGDAVDAAATERARAARLAERLGREPGAPVAPPDGALVVGDLLCVVDGRWWCNGADLGSVEENYKQRCELRESLAREIGPEYAARDSEMADKIVFREYLCPVTGYRIDTELAAAGSEPLHDIRISL